MKPLHSAQNNTRELKLGNSLADEIRAKGEEIVVDLGCGFRKQGNIGIDMARENTQADLICQLGLEAIPLGDATADKIVCRDFLEHVPKVIYLESERRLFYPIIYLMNEIWRILKPSGIFESMTPCYPHPEVFQDPTHVSAWTKETMKYFSGGYPGSKTYGVECNFDIVKQKKKKFYLHAILQRPLDS